MEKVRFLSIISKKFSAPTILNNFYYCFKVPAKTNTIFLIREKVREAICRTEILLELFLARCQLSNLESP